MNDIIDIKEEIESKIKELDGLKTKVKLYGEAKSKAIAEYEKLLAITILKLKNGVITEWEDQYLGGSCPVTILEKIAKGICWNPKLNMEKAENDYKGLLVCIETNGVILSALQTLYRRLDSM